MTANAEGWSSLPWRRMTISPTNGRRPGASGGERAFHIIALTVSERRVHVVLDVSGDRSRSRKHQDARALFDDDVRRAITLSKLGASIADLMLFDRSSLAEARNGGEPPYRILLSDRISAVERFKRRLPCVLEALSWHPIAVETMPRFGKFFENIDWPYVLLETDEYRYNFGIRSGS